MPGDQVKIIEVHEVPGANNPFLRRKIVITYDK
jgi:hypothetical protein